MNDEELKRALMKFAELELYLQNMDTDFNNVQLEYEKIKSQVLTEYLRLKNELGEYIELDGKIKFSGTETEYQRKNSSNTISVPEMGEECDEIFKEIKNQFKYKFYELGL